MKISYHWLQTFFKDPLPEPEKLAELFETHLCEVESVQKTATDYVLDLNILPDRACYLLSHETVAREVSGYVQNRFTPRLKEFKEAFDETEKISLTVREPHVCDRFLLARVLNVSVRESPAWLVERLSSVGQKSINFMVDLTNFVMMDVGHPLHVFDGDKLKGGITVRFAKDGEKITTLDKKEVPLADDILVLADDEGPLDIAGIKGGKKAEADFETSHFAVTCGHFDPRLVRKASTQIKIKTDASKRYENGVSASLTPLAFRYFLALLKQEDKEALIGEPVEANSSNESERDMAVPFDLVRKVLDTKIEDNVIVKALGIAGLPAEMAGDAAGIRIPADRKDISIAEDICEEVGRVLGYESIKGKVPDMKKFYSPNNTLDIKTKIREFLLEEGFSEVSTYALADKGDIRIANPLASDKSFMRTNLSDAMEKSLVQNVYNADLLGLDKVRQFEMGRVFTKEGERESLCVGIAFKRAAKGERPNDDIKDIRDALFLHLGAPFKAVCMADDSGGIILHENRQIGKINNKDGIMEIDLTYTLSILPKEAEEQILPAGSQSRYKPISAYPFVSRDIAVFVPGDVRDTDVAQVIKRHGGELLARTDIFDVFNKGDKTSYAFRMVFQAMDRTLTDDEVGRIVSLITDELNRKEGWKVR